MDKKLIVDLGYPRNATRSIARAMSLMGVPSCHGPDDSQMECWRESVVTGSIEPLQETFDDNVYVGQTVPHLYERVLDKYPDALFIHPVRDPVRWLKSVKHWTGRRPVTADGGNVFDTALARDIGKTNNRMLWRMVLFGMAGFHAGTWLRRYKAHCWSVQEAFRGLDTCLTLNVWEDPEPWVSLSAWLSRHGVDHVVPDRQFPLIHRGRRDGNEPSDEESDTSG